MPNLKKLLSEFNEQERKLIEGLIEAIILFKWDALDVKKLRGYQNVFRVRKGKIRIIFIRDKKDIFILSIDRRNEGAYKI